MAIVAWLLTLQINPIISGMVPSMSLILQYYNKEFKRTYKPFFRFKKHAHGIPGKIIRREVIPHQLCSTVGKYTCIRYDHWNKRKQRYKQHSRSEPRFNKNSSLVWFITPALAHITLYRWWHRHWSLTFTA